MANEGASRNITVLTYTGSGSLSKTINLGFRPSFVMIKGLDVNYVFYYASGRYCTELSQGSASASQPKSVTATDSGITIAAEYENSCMNGSGRYYVVFAVA